ncbi:Uncharacterised protein [Mycobacteroides abscessus subsp. abscessus]|nr:Uncharacterised protein [Mycobacteroides abscessus subsp. abscessus]
MAGSVGSPNPMPDIAVAAAATASSYFARGTRSRVVKAQPCPACIATPAAAAAEAAGTSASSSTM